MSTLAERIDGMMTGLDSIEARIDVISRTIVGRVAFSTSLGLEDQAVLHAIATANVPIDVFTLDTGRHFPETLETLAASEQRYDLKIRVLAPQADAVERLVGRDGVMGFRSSVEARKSCCHVRKVLPLHRGLSGASGWITGLRRGQSMERADVPFARWDRALELIKLNPIADWSLDRIEAFILAHDIPVNPMHDRGFPSIGCQPCTRAIRSGEDIRAGRWWWESQDGKECGLHSRIQHEETAR